ncbi:calmodulin-regulated spectrin-associated protein 1-like isoform X3 [Physella acuta]|uniref:calmodulin-regulated spectrin-associated protein 1-like isoform X3 n=1 Tax=Physella acuta TaxID=109671 RepID=UPI0027DB094E|nr:calmodulin-regulated spectrin-associated protein 1-like isoform X3 [Physella acuta]
MDSWMKSPMDSLMTNSVDNSISLPMDSLMSYPMDSLVTQPMAMDSLAIQPMDSLMTQPMDSLVTQPMDSLMTQPMDSLMTQPMDSLMTQPMDSLMTQPMDSLLEYPKSNTEPVSLSAPQSTDLRKQHLNLIETYCVEKMKSRVMLDCIEADSLDEDESQVCSSSDDGIDSLDEETVDHTEVFEMAKLRASLAWLLSKVHGSEVPKELQDPFYQNSEGQVVLRPVMVNYMSSSELYCQACSRMFPEMHTQWRGHWSIIQVLSRKGIYISDETSVTETVLVQTAPFKLKAHIALIDALMRAYITEVASVEKVVKAVRNLTTFAASSELPSSPEEALKFWINKVCTVLGTPTESSGDSKFVNKNKSGRPAEPVQVPLLEDLMRDIGDGTSVAAVIAYYRPELLNIQDLCLKDSIGIADSLYNLRQIGEFCRNHLPWKCFHLTYEDLLYTHETMKINILTFLADLFYVFEGPGSQTADGSTAGPVAKDVPPAGKRSNFGSVPNVAISSATKKSFQRLTFEDTANNLGMNRTSVVSPSSHQPLLPRRTGGRRSFTHEEGGQNPSPPTSRRGRRTVSLSSPQDRDLIHKSVIAWQDDQRIANRTEDMGTPNGCPGNLLANVSIDSALNQSLNAETSLSIDLSELDTPRPVKTGALDPSHPDYMELESLSSGRPQQVSDRLTNRPHSRQEPLIPAVLRPTKEKDVNLSKAEERGDRMHRRKKVSSPLEPSSPRALQSPQQQKPTAALSNPDLSICSSSSEETTISSLPPGEHQSPGYSAMKRQLLNATESPPNSVRSVTSTAESYTVENSVSLAAARAAGIPVVADSTELTTLVGTSAGERSAGERSTGERSREGSVASSGEYSDHESQKIHQDHKIRESTLTNGNINNNSKRVNDVGITMGKTGDDLKAFIKVPQTTNFAELKRLKDKLSFNLDKSGSQGGPYDKMAAGDHKSSFVNQGQPNSDTPGQLVAGTPPSPGTAMPEVNGADPGSSELQQLRLKLEQKRKEIERKKHRQEAQQTKMRQRLGKAAFMRVVSKHLDGGEDQEEEEDTSRSEMSTQAQLQARLGHPTQRLPLTRPPIQGGIVIPPDMSAQRFTDWRTQTNLSKLGSSSQRPENLDQPPFMLSGDADSGLKPGSKAFSREGIQQTIDNVKNKWFKNSTDIVAGDSEEEVDSYRLHSDLLAPRDQSQSPHLNANTSPLSNSTSSPRPTSNSTSLSGSSASPLTVGASLPPPAGQTSSPRPIPEPEYQEYDSSLDKLNNSLTELQGEIMRLSLQHEQLKAAQSPVSGFDPRISDALAAIGSTSAGTAPPHPRPIHGIPQQAPYMHGSMTKPTPSFQNNPQTSKSDTSLNKSETNQSGLEASGEGDGFFVSFGDSTPKSQMKAPEDSAKVTPVQPQAAVDTPPAVTPQKTLEYGEDGSPSVGFIIKDPAAGVKDQEYEDEMQKKKVKLMEMQRKRKEEQEKRRLEKEAELARKQEEKMMKEEEQERKKAEEKARREVIFQQYLQKKQEEEEVTPPKPRVKKRDSSSGGKPRPKSMFVKTKAMTPEPGAMGGLDSGSSSQEDLTVRTGGRSTPSVMSAMRSAYAFRLPPPSQIRKAVSCNTLQGSPNGGQGPSTYRRPPSPDLYRIKQQRQRGNSQDSGSETGSGSNPGSDYAGPKLFVKPSAKSNRHIIVNAISHCCLAGSVNTDMKNKVLEELSKCEANHFLILFRDAGCQYRGLFIFYPETEEAFKVHGVGPKHITNKMCEKFYKYNSGGKNFAEITSTKHLSVSVDAVVLQGTVWKTGKAVVKR